MNHNRIVSDRATAWTYEIELVHAHMRLCLECQGVVILVI